MTGPGRVDRLIVHQFDPTRPVPGGIDTCLRGLWKYGDAAGALALVGVDAGDGPPSRRLGQWELHHLGGRALWFLPVATLDPSDQRRRIPHSARLVAGLQRYRHRLPARALLQAHRVDVAAAVRATFREPLVYFIHTQDAGLTAAVSDSMWRHAAAVHRRLERAIVRSARSVVVFNPDYAETVRGWNSRARGFPTWYDPSLRPDPLPERSSHKILWVGRLETPKDPLLAMQSFACLCASDPSAPWSLTMVGSGTLGDDLHAACRDLPAAVRARVQLPGRIGPEQVAHQMASSSVFLMTSHPGYEGFPRVLVEAMSAGAVPVVTTGSDTGSLVEAGVTGYVTDRSPQQLARALAMAVTLDRSAVRAATSALNARVLVPQVLSA